MLREPQPPTCWLGPCVEPELPVPVITGSPWPSPPVPCSPHRRRRRGGSCRGRSGGDDHIHIHIRIRNRPRDLFDSSTVHDISVEFDQSDYDAMIEAYQSTGDKEWISATVTIDGTTYENVGLRLKGNSSLGGLGGGGAIGGPGGRRRARVRPIQRAGGVRRPRSARRRLARQPSCRRGPQFDTMGGGSGASADDPTSLPWLIRLDKYVEDQNHNGETQLVVRSNNTATALNEAVSLELLEAAGLATQQATPTAFSVNGSDPVLRLVIQNPDDEWTHDQLGDGPRWSRVPRPRSIRSRSAAGGCSRCVTIQPSSSRCWSC